MRREARVLAALADTDVPHARLIRACDDEEVSGACFYLMQAVDGFNPVVAMPPLHAGDRAVRRRMGFALVDGAVALAKVDSGDPFYKAKLATARFYFKKIYPEIGMLVRTIEAGAGPLMAMEEDWF